MGIERNVVVALACVLAACGDVEPPQRHADGWNLQVANHFGPVVVRAVKGQEKIDVTLKYSGADEPTRHDEIRVAQSHYGQEGQVLVDAPDGDAPDITVEVEVLVPEDTYVEILAPRGDITLDGLTGGGKAQTTEGKIITTNVQGALSLQSKKGDLVLGLRIDDELVQAQTDDGNIEITLPASTNAWFAALANTGTLAIEGIKLDGVTTPNSASGQFGDEGGRIAVQTGNGDIRVTAE